MGPVRDTRRSVRVGALTAHLGYMVYAALCESGCASQYDVIVAIIILRIACYVRPPAAHDDRTGEADLARTKRTFEASKTSR
ncbi:hypothetical protein DENSPDRAFT_832889 [Dentipellis sp. KUC8613]|nr:hypothetical protein DENSPDRAFT_832889 [Dentipellis sp. KUC8613]